MAARLRQRREALAAAEEAVALYRELAGAADSLTLGEPDPIERLDVIPWARTCNEAGA